MECSTTLHKVMVGEVKHDTISNHSFNTFIVPLVEHWDSDQLVEFVKSICQHAHESKRINNIESPNMTNMTNFESRKIIANNCSPSR